MLLCVTLSQVRFVFIFEVLKKLCGVECERVFLLMIKHVRKKVTTDQSETSNFTSKNNVSIVALLIQ